MDPILRKTWEVLDGMGQLTRRALGSISSIPPPPPATVERIVERAVLPLNFIQGRYFLRIAGVSGALAVILGAYGAHSLKQSKPELMETFQVANKYHLMHSIVLLAMPLTRRPYLVGGMFLTGTFLFSGSCYYHVLTGDERLRRFTPIGGLTLIAAWLALALTG